MTTQNEHGKIIAAAAKAALAPLGCTRIGQSRSWISDEGLWVITIEFQPSAWEKGTYLNVRPRWLWLRWGHGDIDMSDRVGNFIAFENAEQFTPLVQISQARQLRASLNCASSCQRFRMFETILPPALPAKAIRFTAQQ